MNVGKKRVDFLCCYSIFPHICMDVKKCKKWENVKIKISTAINFRIGNYLFSLKLKKRCRKEGRGSCIRKIFLHRHFSFIATTYSSAIIHAYIHSTVMLLWVHEKERLLLHEILMLALCLKASFFFFIFILFNFTNARQLRKHKKEENSWIWWGSANVFSSYSSLLLLLSRNKRNFMEVEFPLLWYVQSCTLLCHSDFMQGSVNNSL